MFEIEMPCCGTPTRFDEAADSVGCETCGVVLDLELPTTTASTLPLAA
jgi:ribosomal protein S27E